MVPLGGHPVLRIRDAALLVGLRGIRCAGDHRTPARGTLFPCGVSALYSDRLCRCSRRGLDGLRSRHRRADDAQRYRASPHEKGDPRGNHPPLPVTTTAKGSKPPPRQGEQTRDRYAEETVRSGGGYRQDTARPGPYRRQNRGDRTGSRDGTRTDRRG